MSTPLLPTILEVGLNAIWRTTNDGVSAQITHIALGDAGYTPNQGQTGLQSEKARYPVADGKRESSRQIHLTALADGNAEFWVREVGFYLADGTCLAVWSDPAKPLAYKAPGVDLLLAYDLNLAAVPADAVTVQSTGAGLSLAMAEEFASLAAAAIGGMQRDLQHGDRLDALEGRASALEQARDQLRTDIGADRQRLSALEGANVEQTEVLASLATSLIDTQRLLLAPLTV